MRALVTGASGFVGSALRQDLEARGIAAAQAGRSSVGEIHGFTHWDPFLRDIDVVFHLAGRAHAAIEDADHSYQTVNVDGTRRLAECCAAAGVRRLVFLSSIKVNGEESGSTSFSALSTPDPLDVYGRSKLDAELALAAVSAETGLACSVVRTPLVYGPGVKANFLKLIRAVDRGVPLPFGRIRNRRSLMYVKNLTDVLIHIATSSAAEGRTYLVSDGEDVSTAELIHRIGIALGRNARILPVPLALLRAAGFATGKLPAVRRLTGSLTVDVGPVREELGWRPPFTMAEGLADTAAWYRALR